MGRGKTDSAKTEVNDAIRSIMKNVVNKPPTRGSLRPYKSVMKQTRMEVEKARVNKSAAVVSHDGDMDGALTLSIPLDIPAYVETKRILVRKRQKELMNPAVKMMDPKEILKNPSKTLVSSYHPGFPLENFEQKKCSDPKCNYPLRSYIIKRIADAEDEAGFITFETAEMCCSPMCSSIPSSVKVRQMPSHLYRTQINICDDSLLHGPEEGSFAEFKAPTIQDVLSLNISPHPNPDPEVAMKFVEEYEAAGFPKFELKKIGPMNSDRFLHKMLSDYEEEKRRRLGVDKPESEEEFE